MADNCLECGKPLGSSDTFCYSCLQGSDWKLVEKKPVRVRALELDQEVSIETREGEVVGEPGDMLLVGVEGEVYPCDPEIFAKTYRVLTECPPPDTDELPEAVM